jgi:hypothetical protein
VALICGVVVSALAGADEITVNGNAYKNVLVTQTGSFYYVQIPDEGRTLSVPLAEADASSVKIDSDPFYRDPLKETYTQNRARRAAGEIKDVDPAFRAGKDERVTESLDDVRGAGAGRKGGGGGSAGGFGVPRTMIESALGQLGFQFQPGPGNASAVASRPDGSLELLGPPDNLTGVVAKSSGPVQAADAGVQQLQMFLMQLRPEAAAAFGQALSEAKAKGTASVSAGGVNINITRKVDGANANIEARITAG